jgi:hypothetical protein
MLYLHYAIYNALTIRINRLVPHFKQREDFKHSFYHFIINRIDKNNPVKVLDIGSHDCYLAFLLSQEMHKDSHFDCFDVFMQPKLYLNNNINFHEKDFIASIKEGYADSYDYVILGAVISLFDGEQTDILFEYLKTCKYLFIREVPRYTNIIDVYCEKDLVDYTGWNSYSERELKERLRRSNFEILAVEHEYDIYIYARS